MKNCARKTDNGTKGGAYFCFGIGSLLPLEGGAELIKIVQQHNASSSQLLDKTTQD